MVVSESEWWKLKPSQRKKKIAAFFNIVYAEQVVPATDAACESPHNRLVVPTASTSSCLSISYVSTGITTLSEDHLSKLWAKAGEILRDTGTFGR